MKTTILAMILLSTIVLLLSGCGELSEAEQRFNAGVDFQEEGLHEETIAEYDEAIRLDSRIGAGLQQPRQLLR